MTGTDLDYRPPPLLKGDDLDDAFRLAKALALSGLFPDARKAEQALAKILVGREMGLGAVQSMTGIYIVEGKPMVAAVTLGSFVRGIPDYDYRVLSHSDQECSIQFGRGEAPGRDAEGEWLPWPTALGTSSFSMVDAEKAGLVKDKSGWAKYPRNMLFARAMSNGVKWYCPDATHGIPVYYEGEIEHRSIDGAPPGSGSTETPSISLPDVLAEIDDEALRERTEKAYYEAAAYRPGQLTVAAIQMHTREQPAERIRAFTEEQERLNAEATPAEAEVVADADLGGGSPPTAEGVPPSAGSTTDSTPGGRASTDAGGPSPEESPDVEGLRRELSDLLDQRTHVEENPGDERETEAELARIDGEIDQIESRLRDAGAKVPGQESLGV